MAISKSQQYIKNDATYNKTYWKAVGSAALTLVASAALGLGVYMLLQQHVLPGLLLNHTFTLLTTYATSGLTLLVVGGGLTYYFVKRMKHLAKLIDKEHFYRVVTHTAEITETDKEQWLTFVGRLGTHRLHRLMKHVDDKLYSQEPASKISEVHVEEEERFKKRVFDKLPLANSKILQLCVAELLSPEFQKDRAAYLVDNGTPISYKNEKFVPQKSSRPLDTSDIAEQFQKPQPIPKKEPRTNEKKANQPASLYSVREQQELWLSHNRSWLNTQKTIR